LNGVTRAVAYPNPGFNCNADYGLAQQKGGPGTGGVNGLYVNHAPAGLKGFDIQTLEHCPDFNERFTLLNGVTRAVAYPQPGFNCNADYGLAQQKGGPGTGATKDGLYVNHAPAGLKGFDTHTLEHCPDFNERMTLLNGVTRAVAYPNPGFNCNADYGLVQKTGGPGTGGVNGLYVPYSYSGLKGFDIHTLEHCPDFNERFTLLNGVTRAVAYPQPGFNCNADYGLAQQKGGPGTGATKDGLYAPYSYPGLKGFDIHTLEHCPDFNERHVLLNGVTRAVAYPQPGFNCNADYGLAQQKGGPGTGATKDGLYVNHAPAGLKGFDIHTLEHCPDFNERFTLLNGVTRAVAYPQPGFNCNADYGLSQQKGGPGTGATKDGLYVNHAHTDNGTIANLEHCPNFNERMTLLNGKTRAVSYPNPGFNCKAEM